MNKNYQQTGGKVLKKSTWALGTEKHKPQFTKKPSSKRILRKIKHEQNYNNQV
tara:strand:+ start:60 stop:218 length:159 start_codon:yes stop_codon:yes gene_type:complete